jgi:WD40-like Beta Propeller Repeat
MKSAHSSCISADGTKIFFMQSPTADNVSGVILFERDAVPLIPSEGNSHEVLYCWDLVEGGFRRVSEDSKRFGDQLIACSADGSLLAYIAVEAEWLSVFSYKKAPFSLSHDGTKAVLELNSKGIMHLYYYDAFADRMTLINADAEGKPAPGESGNAVISGDGRYVVFLSDATGLRGAESENACDQRGGSHPPISPS